MDGSPAATRQEADVLSQQKQRLTRYTLQAAVLRLPAAGAPPPHPHAHDISPTFAPPCGGSRRL